MTEAPPSLRGGGLQRVAQYTLAALWMGVIPALLAGLVLRYFVPRVGTGIPRAVARLGQEFPLYLGVALFFLFAALVRYWRYHLPGGRFASPLPAHLVGAERDPKRLDEWASDCALYEQLRTAPMLQRLERTLDRDSLARFRDHARDLRRGLETGDRAVTREARHAVESIARGALAWRRRNQALGTVAAVAGAVAAVFAVRARAVDFYRVGSESMLPTLAPGDHIAGNKFAYGPVGRNTPRRGDVVIFRSAAVGLGGNAAQVPDVLVKRIVGLPGDRISMHGSVPVINGWEVPGCDAGEYLYVFADAPGRVLHGRLRAEFLEDRTYLAVYATIVPFADSYVVKPGEVFVLGDNRGNSIDSRAYAAGSGGGVPIDAIQARAQWFLTGTHRSGEVDLGHLLQPIDRPSAPLRLEGLDVQPLEAGIEKCFQHRPSNTTPPPAGGTSVARGQGS